MHPSRVSRAQSNAGRDAVLGDPVLPPSPFTTVQARQAAIRRMVKFETLPNISEAENHKNWMAGSLECLKSAMELYQPQSRIAAAHADWEDLPSIISSIQQVLGKAHDDKLFYWKFDTWRSAGSDAVANAWQFRSCDCYAMNDEQKLFTTSDSPHAMHYEKKYRPSHQDEWRSELRSGTIIFMVASVSSR